MMPVVPFREAPCTRADSQSLSRSRCSSKPSQAAGIPARQCVGRWVKSEKPGEVVYHQEHVKAELFASGVGWVPGQGKVDGWTEMVKWEVKETPQTSKK